MESKDMYWVKAGGEFRQYPAGTPYLTIVEDLQKERKDETVLVFADGKLQELFKKLKHDTEIRFVTTGDAIGHKTYVRSMSFLLTAAIYEEYGREHISKVRIWFSVDKGLYCTVDGDVAADQAFLDRVDARMRRMAEENLPIYKRTVETDKAISLFRQNGMTDKEKLFGYRISSRVNLYSLNGFEDYFYGYMVPCTGFLKYFSLHLYADGFVIQMPEMAAPAVVPPFRPQNKLFQVLDESTKWADMMGIETVGELDDCISKGDIKQFILVQEALQERKIGEIAKEIASKPDKKFVLIAGPSSSGKTTFSHRLCVQLRVNGLIPHPIAVDNYFLNREQTPLDEEGNKNYECLEAVDIEQLNKDLLDLLEGKTVEIPDFNFIQGKREYKGNYMTLGENDILVLEGIHCLNDALTWRLPKENKFKIYISALTQLNVDEHNRIPSTDGRLIRRMVRDARTRGTSAKKTIAMWKSVRRGEESNIFPYQEEADVMFNSALAYELAVLKTYAEPILFGIEKDCEEYAEAKRLLKFLNYFVGISSENIPQNSLLREFIGGGCFDV